MYTSICTAKDDAYELTYQAHNVFAWMATEIVGNFCGRFAKHLIFLCFLTIHRRLNRREIERKLHFFFILAT